MKPHHLDWLPRLVDGTVRWLRFSERSLGPVADLVIRLALAQVFFLSGVLKLADWDTALYLAEYEYPLAWLDPVTSAWLGTGVEGLGPGRNNPLRCPKRVLPNSQRGMEANLPVVGPPAWEKSPLAPLYKRGGRDRGCQTTRGSSVFPLSQRGMEGDLPVVGWPAWEKSPLAPLCKRRERHRHCSAQPEGISP